MFSRRFVPGALLGLGLACAPASLSAAQDRRPDSTFTHEAMLLGRTDGAAAPDAGFGHSVALSGTTALVGAPFEDGAGAAYVFERFGGDWVLQARLTAPDAVPADTFGWAVALSGNTALIGARAADTAGGEDAGAAYVFVRAGTAWTFQQKLAAADGNLADAFGWSVSLSGDTAVVGMSPALPVAGAAYVFVRSGTAWTQQQKLEASDGALLDRVGFSVTVSGDTAVVGAPFGNSPSAEAGAAYVFVRSGTVWTEQQKLLASDGEEGDAFGWSVSLSGATVVVGAPIATHLAEPEAGVAYVFVRSGGSWSEEQELSASDAGAGDRFGSSVSVSGDTAVAGAPRDTIAGGAAPGSAYAFVRAGTAWSQQQKLTASDGADGDFLGWSVAVLGNDVLAGALNDDLPGAAVAGSVAVFQRSGASWTETPRLVGADTATGDLFGSSVSVSGDTAVVGARADVSLGGTPAGSAYVFVRAGTAWAEQQKLAASDGRAGDGFGFRSSLSGNTVVVGAPFGDTSGGTDAGAAYVFVRSGTTWTEQQKLTAPDGAAGDLFGWSVSLSGDTAVVGAFSADTAGNGAGAVYVFVRSGASWSLQQKLTSSDAIAGDAFGYAVSISGDSLAAGATGDDIAADVDAGSAYVFVRSGGTWTEQQRVRPADTPPGRAFGEAVSLDGDTLAVGLSGDDGPAGELYAGSAYVFTRSGTAWTQEQKLRAEDAGVNGYFGISLSLEGDTLLIGSQGTPAGSAVGAAYRFGRSGTTWGQRQKLTAPDGSSFDNFGASVSLEGGTALVGAILDDNAAGANAGSAHVFRQRQEADLHVGLTAAPEPVLVGTTLTYTATVFNTGPDASGAVTLLDPLPAGTAFQSAGGTGWTCDESAGVVTCTRPPHPLGLLPDVTVVVTAPATPGPLLNTVTVSHTEIDPEAANDSASATSTVSTPTADLTLAKSGNDPEGRWGQPFTWTLVAGNTGPDAAAGATVADDFPPEIADVSWTCTASAGSSCPAAGSGDIGAVVDLLPSGTATFTATGTVQPGTNLLSNLGVIVAPSGVNDPNPANNASAAANPAGPIRYYAVTPCRVVDTRTTAAPLAANSTRTFAMTGVCGVPADTRSVAANLIAVNPGALGDLRLYPTGQPLPLASTLNFAAGRTRANNAVARLGTLGQIDVKCDMMPGSTSSTHFVLDVFGYFR